MFVDPHLLDNNSNAFDDDERPNSVTNGEGVVNVGELISLGDDISTVNDVKVLEAQTCSYVTSNGAIKRDHVRHHKGVYKRWGCTLRPCDIIPQSGMCQCSHKLFDYKL
jgi:hypothetical protein